MLKRGKYKGFLSAPSARLAGFTLTELMVALAINSLLFAALITIFLANLSHYHTMLNISRMNQQLGAVLDLMTNDIRRAGFWGNAATDVNTNQNNNPFMSTSILTGVTDITLPSSSCILFSYDHDNNGSVHAITGTTDDERYGFRLSGQAVQVRPPGATWNCGASSTAWENITDPQFLKITALTFTLNSKTVTIGPKTRGLLLRSVDISITGQLTSDSTITKTLTQHVRIRNDKFLP